MNDICEHRNVTLTLSDNPRVLIPFHSNDMDTDNQCGCALIPVNGAMDISNVHLELCETFGSEDRGDKLTFISCNDSCCYEYNSDQDGDLQICDGIAGVSDGMQGNQNPPTIFNENDRMSEMMLITLSRGYSHNQVMQMTSTTVQKALSGVLVVSRKDIQNEFKSESPFKRS